MEWLVELAGQALRAVRQLLLNPFYYLAILFVWLRYSMDIRMERKFFQTKLHSIMSESGRTVLWGLAAGAAASVVMAALGASLTMEGVLLLWGISLLLALARIRFLCFAYAAGILALAHAAFLAFPQWRGTVLQPVGEWLDKADPPALLALAALLHLLEALLVRMQGARMATPLFLEGKRGKVVGGYQLQGFWPVPLLLLVPTAGGTDLPWTPLFGDGGTLWGFVALPAIIGFTDRTHTRLPKDKAKRSAGLLAAYALVLLAAAVISHYWSAFTVIAGLSAILLHEALLALGRLDEDNRRPLYVHDGDGLKILAILPGSPADKLGLQAGETIRKVNQIPVRTRAELHAALRTNPAYCRLEVKTGSGEIKFASKALYEGEHHQLGIILAPDDDVTVYVDDRPESLYHWLFTRKGAAPANRSKSNWPLRS